MEPTVQILSRFHHVSFLNQQSKFLLDPTAQIISPFCISRVGRLENFLPLTFLVSEKLMPHHMSLLDQRSRSYRDFATSRAFVMPDQWFMISMIRRSRSFRDQAYHEFPHHALVDSSNVQVSEIPIACHVSYDSNGQDCYHDFAYREFEPLSFGFPDLRNKTFVVL
jgi:hypothetical protein